MRWTKAMRAGGVGVVVWGVVAVASGQTCPTTLDSFNSFQDAVTQCTALGCGHDATTIGCYDCTTKTTQATCGPWGCVWNATAEACAAIFAADNYCYGITTSEHLCDMTEGCKWAHNQIICEPCATRNGDSGDNCGCNYDADTDVCTWATPPTTHAPVTVAPTTHSPVSFAPTTVAPTTVAPTAASDDDDATTTIAPTTIAPTTLAPTTHAPATTAPVSHAPVPGGHVRPKAASPSSSSKSLGTGDISAIVVGSVLGVVLVAVGVVVYRNRGTSGYTLAGAP